MSSTGVVMPAYQQLRSDRRFRSVCVKASTLQHVGWILFQTHIADLCMVTAAEEKLPCTPMPTKSQLKSRVAA